MEEGAMAADNYYNCPPGFRFYPTEEELLSFYLRHKLIHFHNHQTDDVAGIGNHIDRLIPLVDIYRYNPWDLPQLAAGEAGEQWFFFSRMQEREARGGRPKRVAGCGYWKATGTLGYVYSSSQNGSGRCIGEKRTMVFYTGKAPKGRKTDWKFNEYKACSSSSYFSNNAIDDTQGHHVNYSSSLPPPNLTVQVRHELSVIRVYKKSKCLRSFDRRPIITTMNGALQQMEARRTMTTTATFNTNNNNNNNNQHIISGYYNMNPADQLQPQPQPQQQQQVVPYLPPTSYNLEAFNYYRPTTAAAETDLPAGQKYPCHDDQPPLVAAPRVEYLSSTGSTDWSLSPPQEMAADDDEETATTSAFSGCVEELDWYH